MDKQTEIKIYECDGSIRKPLDEIARIASEKTGETVQTCRFFLAANRMHVPPMYELEQHLRRSPKAMRRYQEFLRLKKRK